MAGTVITIAQQKGGAGKTTLCAHLALAWVKAGKSVAVIDIDPQASLSAWHTMRKKLGHDSTAGFDFQAVTGWRVQSEVDRRARDHDIVLIDGPPHAETEARISVRAADLVVVPVQPSPMDVWATKPTLDLAKQERKPVLVVLNRVPPRANLTDAMLEELAGLDVPIAQTRIGNRVALAQAMAEGRSVHEAAPGSRAVDEIQALAREILRKAEG